MRIHDPKTTRPCLSLGEDGYDGCQVQGQLTSGVVQVHAHCADAGFDTKFSKFKTQNIVGSCNVKSPICLEDLAYRHRQFSSYEPEVCVFVILNTPALMSTLLMVMTGAKSKDNSRLALCKYACIVQMLVLMPSFLSSKPRILSAVAMSSPQYV